MTATKHPGGPAPQPPDAPTRANEEGGAASTDPLRKTRILAPVDRVQEVAPLIEAGAHELYGGVQPDPWGSEALSANQRTFAAAQFSCEADFARAALETRRLGAALRLTLNAPLYDPSRYPDLVGLAKRAAGWGVEGVIAGDPGLLARLREADLGLTLTLSTLAGALNRWSVDLYRGFGVTRVVLPRHLTLAETASLVGAHPTLDFEAFVLIGRCPNEEGFCTFQHTSATRRWPCEVPYRLLDPDGRVLPPEHPHARWHEAWSRTDRRFGCGLCGIAEWEKLGVRYLKIVGRGSPTSAKIDNVRLVAGFAGRGPAACEARLAHAARFGAPCRLLQCYVPELHPDGRGDGPARTRKQTARGA